MANCKQINTSLRLKIASNNYIRLKACDIQPWWLGGLARRQIQADGH